MNRHPRAEIVVRARSARRTRIHILSVLFQHISVMQMRVWFSEVKETYDEHGVHA